MWKPATSRLNIGGLAKRLIVSILLFSSVITLLATSVQLYRDYTNDIKTIETAFDQIEKGHRQTIANSLWVSDFEQLEVQLQGILDFPGMQYLEIVNDGERLIALGKRPDSRIVARSYPIAYQFRGHSVHLGDFNAVADLDAVYDRLYEKVFIILSSQALKTFLVSFFILFLFYLLVGRHLDTLARSARGLSLNSLGTPITLQRQKRVKEPPDELDAVVDALNAMRLKMAEEVAVRQQNEEERRMLGEKLRHAQKMESIGTLAGGIAHDFNNILGAIIGYAEMAQEESPEGSTVRHDIDQVVQAGYRARELVRQILAFSRQAESELLPMQLPPIIKEAVRLLRSTLPATIEIRQAVGQDVGLVLADPTEIHQVIMNLCTNAYHAMEESGGILTISLEKMVPTATDSARPGSGEFVQLSVHDTGTGIAPELLDKIFDPYFTTKEVGKGTGLGLSIIHGIIRSYGGQIRCSSSPGEGTTFQVLIPVLADLALPSAGGSEPPPRGDGHILFVDDEEVLAAMGKSMLESLGYRVTALTSSVEALALFQSRPDAFALMITDQTMPGMLGGELSRRILHIRPDFPIIICTGYSSLMTVEKAAAMGIRGFVMKPLVKKDIAVLLRRVLAGAADAPALFFKEPAGRQAR